MLIEGAQMRAVADGSVEPDLVSVFADEASFRRWYEIQAPRVMGYLVSRCGGDPLLAHPLLAQASYCVPCLTLGQWRVAIWILLRSR